MSALKEYWDEIDGKITKGCYALEMLPIVVGRFIEDLYKIFNAISTPLEEKAISSVKDKNIRKAIQERLCKSEHTWSSFKTDSPNDWRNAYLRRKYIFENPDQKAKKFHTIRLTREFNNYPDFHASIQPIFFQRNKAAHKSDYEIDPMHWKTYIDGFRAIICELSRDPFIQTELNQYLTCYTKAKRSKSVIDLFINHYFGSIWSLPKELQHNILRKNIKSAEKTLQYILEEPSDDAKKDLESLLTRFSKQQVDDQDELLKSVEDTLHLLHKQFVLDISDFKLGEDNNQDAQIRHNILEIFKEWKVSWRKSSNRDITPSSLYFLHVDFFQNDQKIEPNSAALFSHSEASGFRIVCKKGVEDLEPIVYKDEIKRCKRRRKKFEASGFSCNKLGTKINAIVRGLQAEYPIFTSEDLVILIHCFELHQGEDYFYAHTSWAHIELNYHPMKKHFLQVASYMEDLVDDFQEAGRIPTTIIQEGNFFILDDEPLPLKKGSYALSKMNQYYDRDKPIVCIASEEVLGKMKTQLKGNDSLYEFLKKIKLVSNDNIDMITVILADEQIDGAISCLAQESSV